MKIKKSLKKHYVMEWISILSYFGFAALSLLPTFSDINYAYLPIASFYFLFGCLSLALLIWEILIVKSKPDGETRFKKERLMSRVSGIILLIFTSLINAALVLTMLGENTTTFLYSWMVYAYAAYAFYKLIYAIIALHKARKCYSPYTEVICNLDLISSMFTMLSLEVTMLSIFASKETNQQFLSLKIASMTAILGVSIFLALRLLFSRRTPKALKNR